MHQIIKNSLENIFTEGFLKKRYFFIFYIWKLFFVHRQVHSPSMEIFLIWLFIWNYFFFCYSLTANSLSVLDSISLLSERLRENHAKLIKISRNKFLWQKFYYIMKPWCLNSNNMYLILSWSVIFLALT